VDALLLPHYVRLGRNFKGALIEAAGWASNRGIWRCSFFWVALENFLLPRAIGKCKQEQWPQFGCIGGGKSWPRVWCTLLKGGKSNIILSLLHTSFQIQEVGRGEIVLFEYLSTLQLGATLAVPDHMNKIHFSSEVLTSHLSVTYHATHSPLRRRLDAAIYRVRDVGLDIIFARKVVNTLRKLYDTPVFEEPQEDRMTLTLSHVSVAFALLGIGLTLSVIVSFIEKMK